MQRAAEVADPVGEPQLVELNPAHVTEQRRVQGRRGIKTDQIDRAAMFDLLVAGRGLVVAARSDALLQLQAGAAMRHRRIAAVIAVKNQLLGQMDRAFPGASRCVAGSLLDTKVGRLVIAEFPDPGWLVRLGVERFRRCAAARDIELLQRLEGHANEAEQRIAELLPQTPFAELTTIPRWATVRAGRYGAALAASTSASPRRLADEARGALRSRPEASSTRTRSWRR